MAMKLGLLRIKANIYFKVRKVYETVGVGCAAAIIQGELKGTAPCCGGPEGDKSSCCG